LISTQVSVGDELVRITSLGSPFVLVCGDQVDGQHIVDWLRAFADSRKALTFARGDGFAYQRFATAGESCRVGRNLLILFVMANLVILLLS